ncbi:MAG TPA: hypothetical protein VI793_03935 [Anaerolineales bacterium]|nr:hypothetical protein [Anaerolineales bacterium]
MNRNPMLSTLAIVVILAALVGMPSSAQARRAQAITVPSAVAESQDFATLILRDPWDMSEFTDVSQYLNESGQRNLVASPAVQNGLFIGTSVADVNTGNTAAFFPLFPGYEGVIQAGKVGGRYPIDSATYRCLYFAMNVNSGAANSFGPDQARLFWFADERLNGGPTWGNAVFTLYYGDFGAGAPPANTWRLFKINLANKTGPAGESSFWFGTDWSTNAAWRGIRIDPTINSNISFKVDWVRLTDCMASNKTVTFTSNAAINSIYVRPVGTSNYIRVAKDVNGASGSYALDTQGLAPGSYYLGLGTATSCCLDENTTTPFVVNQAPIATFARPSFTSGPEYSEYAGNAWDFKDSADASSLEKFKSTSFVSGELNLVTASGPQPAGVDARVYLNTPRQANPASYRYLTFRMSSQNGSAAWQNVVDGMLARFVWSVQGASGRQGFRCHLVTHDITFDVGYQTYTVDLYDSFNGAAEEWSPPPGDPLAAECDSLPKTWKDSSLVLQFRFDPNENISCNPQQTDPARRAFIVSTCGDYVQKLDWIKLNQPDAVMHGSVFPVQIGLNKNASLVASRIFYYTDDLSNKTKFAAAQYTPPAPTPGAFKQFLPIVGRDVLASIGDPIEVPNPVTYLWDTSAVAPGTYYICVTVGDGLNTVTYCSEAPVVIQ